MLVFTALGLGHGGALPACCRRRRGCCASCRSPAPWMETLQGADGASPMLATVVFLAGCSGQQTGVDGMAWLLAALHPGRVRGLDLRPRSRPRSSGASAPRGWPAAGAALLVIAGSRSPSTRATVPVAARCRVDGRRRARLGAVLGRAARRAAGAGHARLHRLHRGLVPLLPGERARRAARRRRCARACASTASSLLKADWTMRDDRITAGARQLRPRRACRSTCSTAASADAAPRLLPEVLTPGHRAGRARRARWGARKRPRSAASPVETKEDS